jgi:hypothetical protein
MSTLRRHRWLGLIAIVVASFPASAHAQLAITEVMSVTKLNTNTSFRGAEYWELTNFGTNEVSLHGFGFRDSNPSRALVKSPFANLTLRGGESLILFRIQDTKQSVTNTASFHAWWGDGVLPGNLQCRIWNTPGLSGWEGDEVWLFDAANHLVDRVSFPRAQLGRSFTHEAESGLFGVVSAAGTDGAFAAARADDVGSPGTAHGPLAVQVLAPPVSQTADSNTTVRFSVEAAGLPRPRFQWLHNGVTIPNATQSTLVLSNVHPTSAGAYEVWVTNFMSGVLSAPATLTVNTNATAPSIVAPPVDTLVFIGQTAVFQVEARGLPAVQYQWSRDGAAIAGATSARLEIPNTQLAFDGSKFSVRIWNESGETNASARLTVTPRPDIRFTEVMALTSDDEEIQNFDWFELTNFSEEPVDLFGWHFADEPSFSRALVVTNSIVLRPGEPVVFARRLPAQLFRRWWGERNLPAQLQVFTYGGMGLSAYGEQLFLWNPAAMSPYDYVTTVSWPAATPGVSFEAQQECFEGFCVDEVTPSALGVRGAFRAHEGGYIASPGYIENEPVRVLAPSREANGMALECRVVAGKTYRLLRGATPGMANTTALPVQTATNNVLRLMDTPPGAGAWFYRVEQLP